MYFLLWVVIKEKWEILVWTVHSFQTNVPKVQIWSCCSPPQKPLMAKYCWPQEGPTLTLGSATFLIWSKPFSSVSPTACLHKLWPRVGCYVFLKSTPGFPSSESSLPLPAPDSLRYPHVDWLQWVHISVSVVKDQALESHQPEIDFRFCHLLCGQVI